LNFLASCSTSFITVIYAPQIFTTSFQEFASRIKSSTEHPDAKHKEEIDHFYSDPQANSLKTHSMATFSWKMDSLLRM